MTRVEITQSGRGGSIHYSEGEHRLTFHWEFGGSHVVVLIFGPAAAHWAAQAPWAAGRQEAVFDHVAREVLRQQLPGGGYSVDLKSGTIEIVEASGSEPAGRVQVAASPAIPSQLVPERDPLDALHDHLSIDVRLGAAETLHAADASFDIETILAREIRNLHRPADGLARSIRLAEQHDSGRIRQALLWASWNRTECAPACARLLLRLTAGTVRADAANGDVAERLGPHYNSYERSAAFDELCRLTGMLLDHDAA